MADGQQRLKAHFYTNNESFLLHSSHHTFSTVGLATVVKSVKRKTTGPEAELTQAAGGTANKTTDKK